MQDNCFCERIHGGTVAQPANAWSCLSFVLVGLLILSQAKQDRSNQSQIPNLNPMTTRAGYPVTYSAALVVIGLGSIFYHASLTFAGQFFDVMGMYLLATFIVLYNVARLTTLNEKTFAGSYLLFNLILAYFLLNFPLYRRVIFAGLIATGLLTEYVLRKRRRIEINGVFLTAAVTTLFVAFVIWALDYMRIACDPESWLQGHAVWHILGAAAAGLLFLYYRSENSKDANSF